MFTKEERSSFKYYFAHLCAYNMTALNLKAWKFKYIFHDFEKPWLKLILKDYKKVQKIHRENNKHHLQYKNPTKFDYKAMVIDWECSRFTKQDAPLNAAQTYEKILQSDKYSNEIKELLRKNIPPILELYKLTNYGEEK